MTPAAVLARTNGREAVSRGDVEEVHTLFRWADRCLVNCTAAPSFSCCGTCVRGGSGDGLDASNRTHWLAENRSCLGSPSGCRDAKYSARLLMEQADKYIT